MNQELFKSSLEKQGLDSSDERTKTVLARTKERMGMVPNMFAFMANAPELLETYIFAEQKFRTDSGLTPAEQEVVLLTISYENECDYCTAAHSVIADTKSKVPREVTEAIRSGLQIPDTKLAALSAFTRAMLIKRGRPTSADATAFFDAGYTEKQVLDIVLALGLKTFSNYANHILSTPLDAPFKSREWTPVRASAD